MSKPITTTLNEIRKHGPCKDGWEILLKHLGGTKADFNAAIDLLTILDINGLVDCLWCARATHGHDRLWRLYAVWCARQVQHLMTDDRSIAALDVAERFANGNATAAELAEAQEAARAAEIAARAAEIAASAYSDSAIDIAIASAAAADVLEPNAYHAALDTATSAAEVTAWATEIAASADAWADAWAVQEVKLRQILTAGEWVDE